MCDLSRPNFLLIIQTLKCLELAQVIQIIAVGLRNTIVLLTGTSSAVDTCTIYMYSVCYVAMLSCQYKFWLQDRVLIHYVSCRVYQWLWSVQHLVSSL